MTLSQIQHLDMGCFFYFSRGVSEEGCVKSLRLFVFVLVYLIVGCEVDFYVQSMNCSIV